MSQTNKGLETRGGVEEILGLGQWRKSPGFINVPTFHHPVVGQEMSDLLVLESRQKDTPVVHMLSTSVHFSSYPWST